MEIFYSYSHKDERLRDELEKHLIQLKKAGLISNWHDRKIGAGLEWAGQIDEHINSAHIILLLISTDFLASDYCYDIEMNRAMQRHEAGEALVIPIILRVSDWKNTPFKKLQVLPKDGKPILSWSDRDAAFLNVTEGIRTAILQLPSQGAKESPSTQLTFAQEAIVKPQNSHSLLPYKSRALLDRRIVTEIMPLFSQNVGNDIDPRVLHLLQFGLALFDELIIENLYGSSLSYIMQRHGTLLEDAFTFYQPPRRKRVDDFTTTVNDAGDFWAENPQFQLAVTRYDRLKGNAIGNSETNMIYLQNTLLLARQLDAAIIPHPDRWPLYDWLFEHCLWTTDTQFSGALTVALPIDPLDSSINVPEEKKKRLAEFSERVTIISSQSPLALVRYSPMPYPFPEEMLSRYERKILANFKSFQYEFVCLYPLK